MKNLFLLCVPLILFSCKPEIDQQTEKDQSIDIFDRKELAEPGPMIPPVPAIVLGVKGDSIIPDALSVAWTFVLEGIPGQVGISVTNKIDEEGSPYYLEEFIRKHGEFTLNVPDASWLEEFDDIDMSGHQWEDKFEKNKLTRLPSKLIDAPGVAEASIILECKVLQSHDLPPKRTVFFAEVVRVSVHKDVTDDKGFLNSEARAYFGMTSGNGEFWTFGEKLGNIGMTKGRNDIKY